MVGCRVLVAWVTTGLLLKAAYTSTMKKLECFSPVFCHCKLARSGSAVSLVFGCKVGARGGGG